MSIETTAVSTVHSAEASLGSGIAGIIMILILVFLYNLPWIIALKRKHPNALPIFLLDFFLGWTCIGWIIALIWSCTTQQNQTPINVNITNSSSNS